MVKDTWKGTGYRKVTYTRKHWNLLERLRHKAGKIMETLERSHLNSVVHGSVARGDVNEESDIDVFIPYPVSSFLVETTLERACLSICRRFVVQATPSYAMKAYMDLDVNITLSFPLMNMRKVEREFYRFGGEVSTPDLEDDRRVKGVDKRLRLIEPTEKGHKERSVVGREGHVAQLLDISVETVLDRVHALSRREEVGRTGVFIEREVSKKETFEMVLKKLADENPAVRRRRETY
ncbi:MAG: nucleotidyltransferase domain-containing protein [Thermoproteota archaeon]